jgi:hypothetical protein
VRSGGLLGEVPRTHQAGQTAGTQEVHRLQVQYQMRWGGGELVADATTRIPMVGRYRVSLSDGFSVISSVSAQT